jgi:hypothetical protein
MNFYIDIANEAGRRIVPFQILDLISYFVLSAMNRPSYARIAGLWLPSTSSLIFVGSWFAYVAYQISTEKPRLDIPLFDGGVLAFRLILAVVTRLVNLIASALQCYFAYTRRGTHEGAQEVAEWIPDLPIKSDGGIDLIARARAVHGER